MADTKTKLEIHASLINGEKTRAEINRIKDTLKDQTAIRSVTDMRRALTELSVEAVRAATAVQRIPAAMRGGTHSGMPTSPAAGGGAGGGPPIGGGGAGGGGRRRYQGWRMGSGGMRGFFQGTGMGFGPLGKAGPFVAGWAAGRAIARPAGAYLASPFRPDGLEHFIGSLPGIGEAARAQLSVALGAANQARDFRLGIQDLADISGTSLGSEAYDRRIGQLNSERSLAAAVEGATRFESPMDRRARGLADAWRGRPTFAKTRSTADIDLDKRRALSITPGSSIGEQIRNASAVLGMDPTKLLSGMQTVLRGSGGGLDDNTNGALMSAIAGAQRFGIGAGTVGKFGAGTVSTGQGMDVMSSKLGQAIGGGLELGLRGSDLARYVEQIANGMEETRRTGIQLNIDSVRDLASVMGGSTGSIRGSVYAGQFSESYRNIGKNGPQDFTDVLLMRQLMGGDTSADSVLSAMQTMETGAGADFAFRGLRDTLRKQTGGGAAGALIFQQMLRSKGVSAGARDSAAMFRSGSVGRAFAGDEVDLAQAAAQRVDPGAVRPDAQYKSAMLAAGDEMLQISNAMRDAQLNNLETLKNFDHALEAVAQHMVTASEAMSEATRGFRRR